MITRKKRSCHPSVTPEAFWAEVQASPLCHHGVPDEPWAAHAALTLEEVGWGLPLLLEAGVGHREAQGRGRLAQPISVRAPRREEALALMEATVRGKEQVSDVIAGSNMCFKE